MEAILRELRISEEPLALVENPTPALTQYPKPQSVRRRGDKQATNSRVLKLASIAQYRAKRQIATAEKKLATKLAGQCY